jgi:fructan beta-fructosidase
MRHLLTIAIIYLGSEFVHAQAPGYNQPYRPQVHFTPQQNWINDPNGLVYHDGEYHLFYQYNPFGNEWGHMTWGHAVSTDLVRWQELPPAIAEENGIMAFSGSVVVDSLNSSGFGKDGKTPMIAIYTGHEANRQSQHLAYSLDKGRTWTKYEKNPVLDLNPPQKDFRDPYVFWHAPTQKWVMIVVLPHEQKALFELSTDLKSWEIAGEFQVKNPKLGIWECPSLLEIPVAGSSQSKWLMMISMGTGAPFGGSGMQYFVGDFDGKTFTPQDTVTRYVEYGKDFYAAIPFGNTPRKLMMGWMSNWQYAGKVPTAPFRGAMTTPRELSLVSTPAGIEMRQKPIDYFTTGKANVVPGSASKMNTIFANYRKSNSPYVLLVEGDGRSFGVAVKGGNGQETRIGYDAAKHEIYTDRTQSGQTAFDPNFPTRTTAPLRLWGTANAKKGLKTTKNLKTSAQSETVRLIIVVDRSSVEVFANDGAAVLTNLIFPNEGHNGIRFFGEGIKQTSFRELGSIWK